MNNKERLILISDTKDVLHKLGTDNLMLLKELADILLESEKNNLPF